MKSAHVETSPRLQRVLRLLRDGQEHSTRDIIVRANVCAVNSCIAELCDPKNGYDIECKRREDVWYYRLIQPRQAPSVVPVPGLPADRPGGIQASARGRVSDGARRAARQGELFQDAHLSSCPS
jgi:hypothetical protein